MFRGGVDTFALVINYLNESWIPMHVIVGLFEVNDNKVFHGWAIASFISKVWSNVSCGCFCERWNQQLDIYGRNNMFYC